ncbi:MAG TPA: sulfite exporter TauE/SafE family protein [Nitrosopumilaceae archaeon]|nr:sulfite exporter TauE/SafE family protein [Nitrosopumilaceae archaeon]
METDLISYLLLPQIESSTIILSILSGIIVGFILGIIGGGGSILAVPLLIYVVGIDDPHVAIGTSALAVGANAAVNLIFHKKRGNLKPKTGLYFAIPGILGAIIGSQLGLITPGDSLLVLFGGLMIVIAYKMISRKNKNIHENVSATGSTVVLQKKKLWLNGILVGLASGFFGIGGGFLIMPSLMFTSGLSVTEAIATSLIPVSAFGFTTATMYGIENNINWFISLFFVIGGIAGGFIGTKVMNKIPKKTLMKIFAVVLIIVAFYIIVSTVLGWG